MFVVTAGLLLVPVTFRNVELWPRLNVLISSSPLNTSFMMPSSFKLSFAEQTSSEINSNYNSAIYLNIAGKSAAKKKVLAPSSLESSSRNMKNGKVTTYKTDSVNQGAVKLYSTESSSVAYISTERASEKSTYRELTSNMAETVTTGSAGLNTTETSTKPPGWKVKGICGSALRVLYYIHSAPERAEHRHWLRATIGNTKVAAFVNSSLVFFVGTTPNRTLREKVHEEAKTYGDLVELDFVEATRNQTYKFTGATRWLLANDCLNSSQRVVVKIDDDVMVNVFLLTSYVKYLFALDHSESPSIHCSTMPNSRPIRQVKSKWYVSRKEYWSYKYPPYCLGAAFMMHASVLARLGREVPHVPFLWVEDVYSTGLVAQKAKVTHVDINRHFCLTPAQNMEAVDRNTLFVQIGHDSMEFNRTEKLWKSVMIQNRTR